jgi:hypothetical protein
MGISEAKIHEDQRAFCRERVADYKASPGASMLGFALATRGMAPINGLRHPPHNDTNGWYLWCGEGFSDNPNFFEPLHTEHVYEEFPCLIPLLGLAPGYRFLLSEDFVDVWFDESLLSV